MALAPARGLVAVKPGPVIDVAVKSVPSKDTVELLAVTAERMRHALSRSFLRYNVAGDLDAADHVRLDRSPRTDPGRRVEPKRLVQEQVEGGVLPLGISRQLRHAEIASSP